MLTICDAIGMLKTLFSKGKHLQDTFGLDINDDMTPSGDLFADADKFQCEAKLIFGVSTLSDNLCKIRKFGLQMCEVSPLCQLPSGGQFCGVSTARG